MPIRTCVAVCLMVTFAVDTFERMRTKLAFLYTKPWWINVSVFFAAPCSLPMMLGLVRSIVFDTPGHMWSTPKGWMSPPSTVFTLWNTGICNSAMHSSNELSYVKMMIDDWLSFGSRLWIPDINLVLKYVLYLLTSSFPPHPYSFISYAVIPHLCYFSYSLYSYIWLIFITM